MARPECPACSSKSLKSSKHGVQIAECRKCGAIFGTCYLGESYAIASYHLYPETKGAETFYFDLMVLGSKGLDRRHGWAEKGTNRVVQIG